jgi:hypothetical protein
MFLRFVPPGNRTIYCFFHVASVMNDRRWVQLDLGVYALTIGLLTFYA